MAKATAKVPTTGKEDLSGWEKRVVNAAPLIQSLSRDAPSTAPGPQALLLFIAAVAAAVAVVAAAPAGR